MLPGYIAGHYTYDACHIDLRKLAVASGARLIHGEATGIDRAQRAVLLANRPPIPYDVLSLDIGSTPRRDEVPGAGEHAVAVKPIASFAARWDALVERARRGSGRLRVAVVGGGAGGVELALSIGHRLRAVMGEAGRDRAQLEVVLMTAGEVLASHNERARRLFERILGERGVRVRANSRVVGVEPGIIRTEQGASIAVEEIIWVTEAGTASWMAESGLECAPHGFVKVRETLQSINDPLIFAAGDMADVLAHPRPKAGVFAVRQGPALAANLRRVLLGEEPRAFKPQREFLTLISTGERHAVASRGRWSSAGKSWWRLKDWIDRRFMRDFAEIAPMIRAPSIPEAADAATRAELSALAMRCGGCGAKVGADVLARVMARLEKRPRGDVVIGLDTPDDAAMVRVPIGAASVHTVDFFRAIVDDAYLFGRIAANHALGDIFAMGAQPQTALAIATVPHASEAKVEDTLYQLMSGALVALNEADCALVGGHSAEGAELGLGFAVNGLISDHAVLRRGGLAAGDALILTKPIGTGTLMAAAQRGQAEGRWIDGAIASMVQSSREAAAVLRRFGARACTDVTGFGLLGHLIEMTRASGVDAELRIAAVPLLPGAPATMERGIVSSLQPQNLRVRRAIREVETAARDPRFFLLFDPQTAGGLLAGVPGPVAEHCVVDLRRAGYPAAAIIGRVLARGEAFEPITLV
jgi:selenide,water dikinase